MALSATGRTLRIRRQLQSYSESPFSEDMEDDQQPTTKSILKLKRMKTQGNRLAVRVALDGPADNFVSANVVSAAADLVPEDADVEEPLSSDDEIVKDVRAFVRQTMGKPALTKAEAGICGIGGTAVVKGDDESLRPQTPWMESAVGGNFITVRHPPPDAPIDIPPMPISSTDFPPTWSIPSTCRHWFNPGWVSDTERAELAIFGISESAYRELRDGLIDAYHVDPSKYLSIRAAREATGYGEIGVLTKVWGFLDYWGIINYSSDATSAPRFSKKLIDFPIGRPQKAIEQVLCCSCHNACLYTAYRLRPDAAPLIPKDQILPARFCSSCINSGNYPPFFSKSAFETVDVELPGTVTSEFTEEETMKLVEAIQRYGTDWESVSKMVGGGKTATQSLLHFIHLPINDKLIPPGCGNFKPKQNPFRDESNPLLSVLSIVSSSVPLDVAAQVAGLK